MADMNMKSPELIYNERIEKLKQTYYDPFFDDLTHVLDFRPNSTSDLKNSPSLLSTGSSASVLPPINFEDYRELEPPLLEELEIYPEQILQKALITLNVFGDWQNNANFFQKGTDLAGPLGFCIMLAICLFMSGSKVYFSYIYGLSVISVLIMYCLLSLMTMQENVFNFNNVTSILGYSLVPVVALSVLGIFMPLSSMPGIVITGVAVLWSSLSASKLFVTLSGNPDQRILIAYPCALVCGVFVLLVIF